MWDLKNFLLLTTFGFCTPAIAGINEATQFYQAKKYESAFKEYLPLALAGDAVAQNKLGIMYTNGYGVTKDFKEALKWFEKGAHNNHAEAEYWYATFLVNGYGTEKNPQKSLEWFEKSAAQGNPDAQASLATQYMIGLGAPIDYKKAFEWNLKAAQQGKSVAMYNLAQLYEKGTGISQDSDKAVYWYEQAAKQGHTLSEFELGVSYAHALGGHQQDFQKAIYWYKKAAEKGLVVAQANLAHSFKDQSNLDEAIFWATKAAEQGEVKSQLLLAKIYLEPKSSKGDTSKGINWLKSAANKDYGPAQEYLAEIYHTGNGVNQDEKLALELWGKALSYWEKAASAGDVNAYENLGEIYRLGKFGKPKDELAAVDWYLKVIAANPKESSEKTQTGIGKIYLDGLSSVQSSQKAKAKIDHLAETGDPAAIRFLGRFYYGYGNGYKPDLKLGRFWYEKLASTGDISAQLAIANMYLQTSPNESSPDAAPNRAKAFEWFKNAAEQNNPAAQSELSKMYYLGQGTTKDQVEALKWMRKAAQQGVVDAQLSLAKIYMVGDITMRDYKKSMDLFKTVAARTYKKNYFNFYDAAMNLGEMYENGWGVTSNKIQAALWYSLALESNPAYRLLKDAPSPPSQLDQNPESANRMIMIESSANIYQSKIDAAKAKVQSIKNVMTVDEIQNVRIILANWTPPSATD